MQRNVNMIHLFVRQEHLEYIIKVIIIIIQTTTTIVTKEIIRTEEKITEITTIDRIKDNSSSNNSNIIHMVLVLVVRCED